MNSMLGLAEEDAGPHREPDSIDDEVTSSRISEWLVGLNAPEPEEVVIAREQQYRSGYRVYHPNARKFRG